MAVVLAAGATGLVLGYLATRVFWEKTAAELRVRVEHLEKAVEQKDGEVLNLRIELEKERELRISSQAEVKAKEEMLFEHKRMMEENEARLREAFGHLASEALKGNNQAFLDLAQKTLEGYLKEAKSDLGERQKAIEHLLNPFKEALNGFGSQVMEFAQRWSREYGMVSKHLEELSKSQLLLKEETGRLASALRRPRVRGRWGEMTLRNVVEAAGMTNYVDFLEQAVTETEGSRLRPDVIVRLPNSGLVVIDAKVPLDSYLDAMEGPEERQEEALKRHALAVRQHVLTLAGKEYQSQFRNQASDFVVMFLPLESAFVAAVEKDRELLDFALKNRVLLATPLTLLALLRAVAYGWMQREVAEKAQGVLEAGRELYERVAGFSEHLDKIRRGLGQAVEAYNQAVGSWQNRVLPQGRKVREMIPLGAKKELVEMNPIETGLRELP